VACAAIRSAPLQAGLQRLDHLGIEELSQVLLTEQLAQHMSVERECLGPPLRQRKIPLIEVGRRIGEDE
jgi:hypothetical protein